VAFARVHDQLFSAPQWQTILGKSVQRARAPSEFSSRGGDIKGDEVMLATTQAGASRGNGDLSDKLKDILRSTWQGNLSPSFLHVLVNVTADYVLRQWASGSPAQSQWVISVAGMGGVDDSIVANGVVCSFARGVLRPHVLRCLPLRQATCLCLEIDVLEAGFTESAHVSLQVSDQRTHELSVKERERLCGVVRRVCQRNKVDVILSSKRIDPRLVSVCSAEDIIVIDGISKKDIKRLSRELNCEIYTDLFELLDDDAMRSTRKEIPTRLTSNLGTLASVTRVRGGIERAFLQFEPEPHSSAGCTLVLSAPSLGLAAQLNFLVTRALRHVHVWSRPSNVFTTTSPNDKSRALKHHLQRHHDPEPVYFAENTPTKAPPRVEKETRIALSKPFWYVAGGGTFEIMVSRHCGAQARRIGAPSKSKLTASEGDDGGEEGKEKEEFGLSLSEAFHQRFAYEVVEAALMDIPRVLLRNKHGEGLHASARRGQLAKSKLRSLYFEIWKKIEMQGPLSVAALGVESPPFFAQDFIPAADQKVIHPLEAKLGILSHFLRTLAQVSRLAGSGAVVRASTRETTGEEGKQEGDRRADAFSLRRLDGLSTDSSSDEERPHCH